MRVLLVEHASMQLVDLDLSQETPLTTAQILLVKTSEIRTVKTHHLIAEVLENTANDTVAT